MQQTPAFRRTARVSCPSRLVLVDYSRLVPGPLCVLGRDRKLASSLLCADLFVGRNNPIARLPRRKSSSTAAGRDSRSRRPGGQFASQLLAFKRSNDSSSTATLCPSPEAGLVNTKTRSVAIFEDRAPQRAAERRLQRSPSCQDSGGGPLKRARPTAVPCCDARHLIAKPGIS
jgi:hypothetical protein